MKILSKIKALTLFSIAGSALVATAPAQALTINLIDDGTVAGTAAEQGFAIAARYWESVITNDATLNFVVGYAALDPGVLGGTRTALVQGVDISTYFALLGANANKSALDTQAVANLPTLSSTGSVEMVVSGYLDPATQSGIDARTSRIAPDGTPISSTIALATSNAKALVGGGETLIDGQIQFSSNFNFDFNPTDGITRGSYDFIGVAIHEIGHALGFLSGADDFNYSNGYTGNDVDDFWWAYGLDMFRYTKAGPDDGVLNVTPGSAGYFSVDGGATAYEGGYFSTGEDFGDGWQASHWKSPGDCSTFLGILNPYICNGSVAQVKGLDIAAFDAIGWNFVDGVRDNAGYVYSSADAFAAFGAVPEPATWAMMIAGFGLAGVAMRRRKANVSFA